MFSEYGKNPDAVHVAQQTGLNCLERVLYFARVYGLTFRRHLGVES